jgi:mutator protein MutT
MADPAAHALVGATEFNDQEGFRPEFIKFAAVLVPIVLHPQPSILLTLRAAKMSAHAGQVSFPGGRIETGETPEAAAVREAAEEVGLDPRLPELLGRLPEHHTGTGFHITPVVALVPPPLNLVADPREVEEPFELPLSVILDPHAPERRTAEWKGRTRQFWVWPHERHYIWGATAAILVNLAKVLRGH